MNSRKPKLIKITKKNEYLRMRSGLKISTPGFILQARQRENEDTVDRSSIRKGFKGWDYVLIGKEQTTEKLSFKIQEKNLTEGLVKLHKIGIKKFEKN